MKTAFILFSACATISTQAAIFEFDLGPAVGGFGLNGANERPVPAATPATGGEVKDFDSNNFINYNDSTKQLELHFAWGNDPSFDYGNGLSGTALTGNLTGLHIHGPADVNSATGVLYDLLSLAGSAPPPDGFFNASGDGRAGAIDLVVQLVDGAGGFNVAQQEAQLLGNNWYINIHSTTFTGGEIRGQLLNVIPEPEHYAAFAGLALLGFAGYRRYKSAPAI